MAAIVNVSSVVVPSVKNACAPFNELPFSLRVIFVPSNIAESILTLLITAAVSVFTTESRESSVFNADNIAPVLGYNSIADTETGVVSPKPIISSVPVATGFTAI